MPYQRSKVFRCLQRCGHDFDLFFVQITSLNLHLFELAVLSDHFSLLLFLSGPSSTCKLRRHYVVAVAVGALLEAVDDENLATTHPNPKTKGKGSTTITQALIPPLTHSSLHPTPPSLKQRTSFVSWWSLSPRQPNHIPRPI